MLTCNPELLSFPCHPRSPACKVYVARTARAAGARKPVVAAVSWPAHSLAYGVQNFDMVDGGAGSRVRTRDPLITNQVLYQLSYTGLVNGSSIVR